MLAADGHPGPNTLRQVVDEGAEDDLQEQARFLAEQETALELEQDASEGDVVAPRITAPPGIAAENRLAEEAAPLHPHDTVEGDVEDPVVPRISPPPGIDDENELPEEAALIQPPRDTVEGDVLAPVSPR